MSIFRVTEILSYKRCHRKWHFSSENRLGLAKLVPSAAFNLGTAIHTGLEKWIQGEDPVSAYLTACANTQHKIETIYQKLNGSSISDQELAPLLDTVRLGTAMMTNYREHWKSPLPPNYISVKPEQRIMVPIPNTPHFLSGKMDGILGDEHGRLFVLDHKSYKNRPKREIIQRAEQFIAYVWMLTQIAPDLNMEVAGLAYDGLWKREVPPGVVDGKKGVLADLFHRFLIIPSQEEIEEYGKELTHIANEMANPDSFITHHRTTDGSCTWGCSYDDLCIATSRGEDTQYTMDSDFIRSESELINLLAEQDD